MHIVFPPKVSLFFKVMAILGLYFFIDLWVTQLGIVDYLDDVIKDRKFQLNLHYYDDSSKFIFQTFKVLYGYLVEILYLNEIPTVFTLSGAILMITGIYWNVSK